MTPVQSSNLAAYDYDAEKKVFKAQFKATKGPGAIWTYAGVPPEKVEAFEKAPSKGEFFSHEIRGKYPAEKYPAPEAAKPQAEATSA